MVQIQHTTSSTVHGAFRAPALPGPIARRAHACRSFARQFAAGIDAQSSLVRGIEVPSDHASRHVRLRNASRN